RADWGGPILRRLPALGVRPSLRRLTAAALALAPRGFAPRDVPRLRKLSAQLRVEWCTRDIHPWDRSLPVDQQTERLRLQTLHDTDAAIVRFFDLLPEIERTDLRVVEPRAPNRLSLAGVAARAAARATRHLLSPAMRLKMMGDRVRLDAGRLAPLD